MKIFIVEDNVHVLQVIRLMLDGMGHEVAGTAASVRIALRDIAVTEPDLCIVDMALAENSSGLDLVLHLQHHYDMPSIIITGDPFSIPEVNRATIPHLVKPFNRRGLGRLLNDLADDLTLRSSRAEVAAATGRTASA